jgi:superfamily I DNA/RNA helicase
MIPAPLLVLAGAGSGKTETLIRRVADLILTGEAPNRLLCITAKAASEMRSRLAARLGERTPRWIGTFHAVMAWLLIEDGAGVPGLPRGFAILGQRDARALLMQVAGMTPKRRAYCWGWRRCSRTAWSPAPAACPAPRRFFVSSQRSWRGPLASVLPAYQAALAQRQARDFDDLIAWPVAAMRADPILANRWSGRWAEILLDEYQDTNHAQHALVGLLAGTAGRVPPN